MLESRGEKLMANNEQQEDNVSRLIAARKKAGLAQEKLGEQLEPKANKQQIYRYEKRQTPIRPKVAAQFAEILGGLPDDYVDEEFLLGAEDKGRAWIDDAAPASTIATGQRNVKQVKTVITERVMRAMMQEIVIKFSSVKFEAKLDGDFYAFHAREATQALRRSIEKEPERQLTSHLAEYLLLMLGTTLQRDPVKHRFDYQAWRESVDAAAAYGLTLLENHRERTG